MKILQLCKKFPFPAKDGESLAISYLAQAFDELGNEVTLLAMNTSKHWIDPKLFTQHSNPYAAVHTVDIDNKINPFAALLNLFSEQSYHIQRFVSRSFEEKLIKVLEDTQFDVVQLETLYLAPYIPTIRKHSKALIALRAHNVEHEIWERITQNSRFLKKWYLESITPRLKKFEITHLNQYDLLIGITERDVDHFRRLGLRKPAVATPIGLDCRDYRPDQQSYRRPLSLGFIGSLDWMPNLEGLNWFLGNIWKPVLSGAFPELTLHIAGRNTPAWLKDLHLPRVIVHGEVPDAASFINQHSVMVVPLLSGGGMRAKILEGMALGKVVLSTSIGLEGIPAKHKKEALIADTPEAFSDAISWCYGQGASLETLGHQARQFCLDNFDNMEVARQLLQTYGNLCPQSPALAV